MTNSGQNNFQNKRRLKERRGTYRRVAYQRRSQDDRRDSAPEGWNDSLFFNSTEVVEAMIARSFLDRREVESRRVGYSRRSGSVRRIH